MDLERENARKFREGKAEGLQEANERIAVDMLRDGKPIHEISKYSKLTENVIYKLASSLKIIIA